MARRFLFALIAAGLLTGCRKFEPRTLDPVLALKSHVGTGFRPPADGLLTDAQIDRYVKARRAAGGRPESEAAGSPAVDRAELAWIRARVVEALVVLDTKQVTDAAIESYASAIAALRETRRSTHDPKGAARIDAEIAALERERASVRRSDAVAPATLANAARVFPRRVEIESLGP